MLTAIQNTQEVDYLLGKSGHQGECVMKQLGKIVLNISRLEKSQGMHFSEDARLTSICSLIGSSWT